MILLHHKPGVPHHRNTILSLGQATTQILLGALLILSSSPSSSQSSGSSIVAADASSLFDSLTSFVRINNNNNQHHFRESDENQHQQEQLANFNALMEEEDAGQEQGDEHMQKAEGQKGTLVSILESVYSFAAKKVGVNPAPTAGKTPVAPTTELIANDDDEQLRFQYQGTSRHLGQWDLVGVSGVSAMHATLIPNTNKIVFLEKVEKNTHAYLTENAEKFAFSVEYDIDKSTFRPLHTKTNQFCSAGGYRPDGTIVSLGGAEAQSDVAEGWNSLRFLSSCNATHSRCDWDTRNDITLKTGRWYPT
ncbi:hypothetical protein BG015_005355, partial [Linnemannia schmuckeri]